MKMEDPLARLGNLAPLIEKHAPLLYLHPSEDYVTGAFEDYLADPAVHFGPPAGNKVPEPLPSGDDTRKTYLSYDWNNGQARKGDLKRTRIYIHALEHQVWGKDHPPGIALQFWIWYPFNGPATGRVDLRLKLQMKVKVKFKWPPWKTHLEDKTLLDHSFSGTIGLEPFGEHEGDWECVTLFFDKDERLQLVRCDQHDYYTDYKPIYWEQTNGRPVVYSARNGHPSYLGEGEHLTQKEHDGKLAPVGADESVDFDAKAAKVKADVSVRLINECRKGPLVDCASHGRLVAVSATTKNGPLAGIQGPPPPSWIGWQGSAGDPKPKVSTTSKQFVDDFTRSFANVFLAPVDKVMPGLIRKLAHDITESIVKGIAKRVAPPILKKIGEELGLGKGGGPRMPAGKDSWHPDWQAK